MAASQPGTSSSAQIADNRGFLFRLQMLIIDGGLTSLRNYVDQELAAQSTTLSASLAKEKTTITLLKGRKIITQVQYDLLYPSYGSVSTSDLDITLIICLMRNLKCFKLNTNFNWNITPAQSDYSIEADICRLKNHRNEICHISTTTGIQLADFINKWKEIEQILLRIDKVCPVKNFQQKITDFQFCTLDTSIEKRVTDEIEKWNKFDKSVETDLEQLKTGQTEMKQTIETLAIEQAETRKRTSDNKEELKTVNVKIAKIEQQLPEADNYQQRKIDLQHGLFTFYKARHSKVFLSPLFEEKDTPLASFYIRPELNSVVSTPTRNDGTQARNDENLPVNSLSEMFKTGNEDNREIHVLADAGLGKTAFSKYLANVWCQAHCPDEDLNEPLLKADIDCMQEFDFLFLLLLRDAGNLCSIDDLIFKKIISDLGLKEKISEDFLYQILLYEKCLVILDGLDEWTHPENQKNECNRSPRSIPHRNDREKCTVLTTTRPWKLGVLNLNSCQIGKQVELKKLSYDSTVTLTKRILKRLKPYPNERALQEDVWMFISEIERRQHYATAFMAGIKSRQNDELMSVPLLLIYTICLWCDGVQIGNSKCDLYINIVELLISRTIQKHGELQIPQELLPSDIPDIPECFAKYENCKTYFKLLLHLGELADYTLFNKTKENALVFDRSVAEKYITQDEMKFTLHSGILSESTSKTLTKRFSKVSFSHKTVQEFFAAIFISSENDARKTVQEKCKNVREILDMSIFFEYIIEMNADLMREISNDLMSVINEDENTRDYRTRIGREYHIDDNPLYNIQNTFMACLQEMPESENIQLCLQDFFINESNMDRYSEQVQRLLKQNKANIKSLYLDRDISLNYLREITDLFSLTDLSHIQTLYYVFGDDCVNGIADEPEIYRILFPSLQYVILSGSTWTNYEENLSANLSRVQNVQYLHIHYFTLSHKTLERFFNFISGQKSMKQLSLMDIRCEEHDDRHDVLNLDLSQLSTLSELYLQNIPWRLQLNILTPSLVNVVLLEISLDDRSLLLSRDMLNIKSVDLGHIEMPAGSLQNFITVLEKLPQSVTVYLNAIKPKTEYESVKENIWSSQTCHVHPGNYYDDYVWLSFETRKQSKE